MEGLQGKVKWLVREGGREQQKEEINEQDEPIEVEQSDEKATV